MPKRRIVMVTGLSGAGKTIFLRALEDAGFYCVDNIPVKLIPSLVGISERTSDIRALGLGIDIRDRNLRDDFSPIERNLRRSPHRFELVFLEADDTTIARRFKETRRPHPLAGDAGSLREAVSQERDQLENLRESADRVLDTSSLTPHQLRDHVLSVYGTQTAERGMQVHLMSFGFKYGSPSDADLVMDVRFLPNPHFVPEFKPMTGLEHRVARFVFNGETARSFLRRFSGLLRFLLPLYIREGKTSLTIAVGCTGGRHRSPAVVERIAKALRRREDISVSVSHRDIGEQGTGEDLP